MMDIEILNFVPAGSPQVQGFFNIRVGGWFVVNGLVYLRNGEVDAARLVWQRNGRRHYLPAIAIPDADLHALVAEELKAAIEKYVAGLPERTLPPAPPRPPKKTPQPPPPEPRRATGGLEEKFSEIGASQAGADGPGSGEASGQERTATSAGGDLAVPECAEAAGGP
jgi:hypothetical protein